MVKVAISGEGGIRFRSEVTGTFQAFKDVFELAKAGALDLEKIFSDFMQTTRKAGSNIQKTVKKNTKDFIQNFEAATGKTTTAAGLTRAGSVAAKVGKGIADFLPTGKTGAIGKAGTAPIRAAGKGIAWIEGIMTQISNPLKEASSKIGNYLLKPLKGTKTLKALKAAHGMFKEIAGQTTKAWVFEQLFKLLEPFLMLLKPFEPIISAIAGLLSILFAEILKPIMPLVSAFVEWLMKLAPLFRGIGEVIGNYIVPFFVTLGQIFYKIGEFVVNFLIIPLRILWDVFVGIGTFIANVFTGVWTFLEGVIQFFRIALIGVGNAFIAVYNTIIDIINWIVQWVGFGWAWGWEGLPKAEFLTAQAGAVVDKPTMALIGEGGQREFVFNEEQMLALKELGFGNVGVRDELERNNYLLEKIYKDQTETNRWKKWEL